MSIKTTHRSFSGIHIDFQNSYGSYLFDKKTNKQYLDFFGMFSSLPLGYNHSIFDGSFYERMIEVSSVKVTNCEISSDVYEEFCEKFSDMCSVNGMYENFHFTCTGSLAVECAIKTAIDCVGGNRIVSLKNSFHGIQAYGNFVTDSFSPIDQRLFGFPNLKWPKVETINELLMEIKEGGVAAVIVEPIQSTFGDNHLPKKFLQEVSRVCVEYNIPLIFDEIQTGFGASGKMWYFEYLDILPDIVIFGKKSQVSGIMTTPKYPFPKIPKLSVTFDGDIVDMLRSIYVMKAYEKFSLLENCKARGEQLCSGLYSIDCIYNVRSVGLLLAFDLNSKLERDDLVLKLREKGFLCNPTREKTIRLRPNLAVTKKEIDSAIDILRGILL
jgi:L-lysine 6-transaminase